MSAGISVIIIGKNEEQHIQRCIESVYVTLDTHCIQSYELIYVDSRSADRSLDIVGSFPEVKRFVMTGACNAAMARNAGASIASKETFLFVDADMELKASFFEGILDRSGRMKGSALAGWIADVEQGEVTDIRYKDHRKSFSQPTLDGGIFLIKRDIWSLVGGMRTKYKTGEDGDLGLRLAALKIPFRRVPKLMTLHHTVSYHDPSRMWKMVWNKSIFYWRCVLYRDHFFNPKMYALLWQNDKSLIFLIVSLVAGALLPQIFPALMAIYLILVIMRVYKQQIKQRGLEFFTFYLLVDVLNIVNFFTFFPKSQEVQFRSLINQEQLSAC